MPSLLSVTPACLVVVAVVVALIAFIVRELDAIGDWETFPVIPSWRIFGWRILTLLQLLVTPLRLAYLAIIGSAVCGSLALAFLATGGHPTWLDDLVILILLAIQTLIVAWAIYFACIKWEPIVPPKTLPV